MKSYLQSNFIKIKNTSYLLVHILATLLFPLLLFFYWIQRGDIQNNIALFSYFQIVGVLLPFASSIVTIQLKSLEEEAGKFKYLLGYSLSSYMPFFIELIFLWMCYCIVLLVSFALFGIFVIMSGAIVNFQVVFLNISFYIILAFATYIINHIISYLCSIGVALGISMIGVIVAAFCETSLGDKVWFFIPWSWPLRISDVLFNQQKIASIHLIVMAIISIAMLLLHRRVFQNWNQDRLTES
ncbi:lantibiotic immunity ABC transporter MutG family permease subunit [Streptococcus merionis]|uniref:Lantibiotic transport permease n=1 Tax=Streptococcus merionis TaxID=400065 RepID=A0A239SNI7_9STRE|nr:lantibiotic immunity ABC transporter MutG family permease subunit [Streptococcus merionis]SNU86960.1 lantibiotic transport permease [Streptococcus merionis]